MRFKGGTRAEKTQFFGKIFQKVPKKGRQSSELFLQIQLIFVPTFNESSEIFVMEVVCCFFTSHF